MQVAQILENGYFTIHNQNQQCLVLLKAEWTSFTINTALQELENARLPDNKAITVDFSTVTHLDIAGAFSLHRFHQTLVDQGKTVNFRNFSAQQRAIFREISRHKHRQDLQPPYQEKGWIYPFERLGFYTFTTVQDALKMLEFIGEISLCFWQSLQNPSRFRGRSIVYHLEKVGFDALPIVGLISFLIGVVLVYQGAYQLRRFGAEIFTVDLLVVSALREIGILLTAIVVAGRTGSAFAAQIGYMKLNQEVNAMWVMGINPLEALVLPRLIALIITLPLLSFYSDIMALLGGGIMCHSLIDLSFKQFLHHAQLDIKPWTFWTGIIKAPVFAASIAIIGCFEGMQVSGGAESVGERTTRAVVKSIFLVIVLDALFSIFYSRLGI